MQKIFFIDTLLNFYNELFQVSCFLLVRSNSTTFLIIMSSPGQKRGSCGHVMALFDNHKKCARCRDKGVGDDPCVKKLDCSVCKAFTPAQIHQLATPTYKERKERSSQKKSEDLSSASPKLVDPSEVSLLGPVKSGTQSQSTRRSVLMVPQGLVNGSTVVSLLQTTSSPLMTSGVRDFPVWKQC